MCELLPTLERRDGLSGSNTLYHMNLSNSFTLTPLCSNSSAELPSQSSPTDRTVGIQTPNSKRTIDGSSSPPSGQSAKKARRRTAARPPLVQHNAEKKQKESNNVSPILQQHKTTVCVYWNKHTSTCCFPLSASSPVAYLFTILAILLHVLAVQTNLNQEAWKVLSSCLAAAQCSLENIKVFRKSRHFHETTRVFVSKSLPEMLILVFYIIKLLMCLASAFWLQLWKKTNKN